MRAKKERKRKRESHFTSLFIRYRPGNVRERGGDGGSARYVGRGIVSSYGKKKGTRQRGVGGYKERVPAIARPRTISSAMSRRAFRAPHGAKDYPSRATMKRKPISVIGSAAPESVVTIAGLSEVSRREMCRSCQGSWKIMPARAKTKNKRFARSLIHLLAGC